MYLSQSNGPALYYYKTITETIEHIRKSGFTHVDISFFSRFQKGSIYFSDEYMKVVDEYREALKKYGVTPVQAHEPTGNSLGDDGGEYYMKKTPRAIEMAAKIGCPSITIHPGHPFPGSEFGKSKEAYVEGNVAAIKKLIPYAEEYGIELLLENIGYKDLPPFETIYATTADDLIAIVDEVNHPLVAVNWDIGHANFNGLDEYAEMTRLGSRLRGVHVHDNIGFRKIEFDSKTYEGDMHTFPLFYNVDFDGVIKALIDTGYKGTFNFEVDAPKFVKRYTEEREELQKSAQEVRLESEKLLYSIGKLLLEKYGIFEG